EGKARQREAEGRDHQLRRAREALDEELRRGGRSGGVISSRPFPDGCSFRRAATRHEGGARGITAAPHPRLVAGPARKLAIDWEAAVSLELKAVVKRVAGETHIHETSVALKEGGFNVLLGTTLAGKTTLMQLMA